MKEIYLFGKSESFEAVYETYYDRIYKYAYTLLLNKEDAEDVTADTFLTAYMHFSTYDAGQASVATWLSRIVHNRAVNLRRSAAYAKRTELPDFWEPAEDADFTAQVEAADAVLYLYARLRPEERELLNLRYVMELKDGEIAALFGCPEKTLNKRIQRLLGRCRQLLDEKSEKN